MSSWIPKKKIFIKKDRPAGHPESEEQEPAEELNGEIDCVEYVVIRCPRCASENTKIYKHNRPIRYHKCQDCGHNFKSIEKPT